MPTKSSKTTKDSVKPARKSLLKPITAKRNTAAEAEERSAKAAAEKAASKKPAFMRS